MMDSIFDSMVFGTLQQAGQARAAELREEIPGVRVYYSLGFYGAEAVVDAGKLKEGNETGKVIPTNDEQWQNMMDAFRVYNNGAEIEVDWRKGIVSFSVTNANSENLVNVVRKYTTSDGKANVRLLRFLQGYGFFSQENYEAWKRKDIEREIRGRVSDYKPNFVLQDGTSWSEVKKSAIFKGVVDALEDSFIGDIKPLAEWEAGGRKPKYPRGTWPRPVTAEDLAERLKEAEVRVKREASRLRKAGEEKPKRRGSRKVRKDAERWTPEGKAVEKEKDALYGVDLLTEMVMQMLTEYKAEDKKKEEVRSA